LAAAQAIGFTQVWVAGRTLYAQSVALAEAGYLTVPNGATRSMLLSFKTALVGGLLFTLTIGAGLVVLTFVLIYLSRIAGLSRRLKQTLGGVIYLAGVILPNLSGFNAGATLYMVAVPIVVWLFLRSSTVNPTWSKLVLHWVPLAIIAALMVVTTGDNLFITIRDRLLLTNPVGRLVNDAYYRHTLAAVAVIQSLQQKQMRACHIESSRGGARIKQLAARLVTHDYLPVHGGAQVEVTLQDRTNGQLTFVSAHGDRYQTQAVAFEARPAETLAAVSAAFDRQTVFRQMLFWGLVLGLPVLVYGAINLSMQSLLNGLFSSISITAVLLLFWGIVALALVVGLRDYPVPESQAGLAATLKSQNKWQRVAALQAIARKRMELATFGAYTNGITSPVIAERYWTAHALAAGDGPEARRHLLRMLHDPQSNVVCMVLQSLGSRGDRRAIAIVTDHLSRSTHWYEQFYAYKALRRLGWVQSTLP
jgi:hypothetical protein